MAESFSTDKELRALGPKDKDYKARDAMCKGLYVYVSLVKDGADCGKTFRYDYTFNGKRKTLTLGRYPRLTLSEARKKLENAKTAIDNGLDPAAEKQKIKAQYKAEEEAIRQEKVDQSNTFQKVVSEWLQKKERELRPSSFKIYCSLVKNHIIPAIGNIPVKSITQDNILNILKNLIEQGKHKTANKICPLIKEIFQYFMGREYIEKDCSYNINKLLPKIDNKSSHFAAITEPDEVAIMLKSIDQYIEKELNVVQLQVLLTMKALRYMPLRISNLLSMKWKDIDFENAKIVFSADKMKSKREFTLYLSKQAISIFRELEAVKISDYVFASRKSNGSLDPLTVSRYFGCAKVPTNEQSLHGWRATFSSLCRNAGAPRELSERCLAHITDSEVEQAYNRATYEKPMRKLMQWYADCMDSLAHGNGMLHLNVSEMYS